MKIKDAIANWLSQPIDPKRNEWEVRMYLRDLRAFVKKERAKGKAVQPDFADIVAGQPDTKEDKQ